MVSLEDDFFPLKCAYAPKVRYALPHPRSTRRAGD